MAASNATFTWGADDRPLLIGVCVGCFPTSFLMNFPTVSRAWATPLLLACFALMAGTGVLMFLHRHSPLQEDIHAWLGWGVLAAAALHVAGNFTQFKRHFAGRRPAVALLTFALALLVGTSLLRPVSGEPSVPALAVQTLARAPLRTLAPVFGLSVAEARQVLENAGLAMADDDTSLDAAAQGRRDQIGNGLKALAAASRPVAR